MSFLVIFLCIVAALFVLAFVTKRRFGALGLALAAGAMLGTLWVGQLTPLVARAGVTMVAPPLHSVVAAVLIVLPAVPLLFSGSTYKSKVRRIVGASLFAILAAALLLEPLGAALVVEGPGKPAYDLFVAYRPVVITVCLMLAVLDLVFIKIPKYHDKH